MSENRHPNKKRRASSPDEQVKRIRLPRSSVAASAGSIAATSANASHGSNSNKRAREEQSIVPSNKRARTTPAPAPATLPLPLPFTLAPPAPRVTKSNKLSAEQVPIYRYRSTEQKLREAAAALIALAQQAQNINKSSSIDEAVVLPGGKRIRIEVPVISSSNNNGIGRPRPSRRRNNVAGPIPIWNLRTAPAPTAPAPEATAATSTATASNQAASNKIRVMPSTSILLSNNRKQNKGCSVRFSEKCMEQPFDKESSSENVSYDFEQQVIPMKMSLHDVVEEGQPPEEEEGPSIGDEAGDEPAMDANESESMPEKMDDSSDDDDLPDLEGFTPTRSGEKSKVKVVRYDIDDLPPAFENEEDYPPGWLVYHPKHGVITRERLLELERGAATEDEEVHFNVADNAAEEDGDEDEDVVSTTEEEEDEKPSNTEDNEASIQTEEVHFNVADNSQEEDGGVVASATSSDEPQFEVAAAAMDVDVDDDGQESVDFDAAGYNTEDDDTMGSNPRFEVDDTAAMDATAMDVDNDGQDSVNSDVASNISESNNTEVIEEPEEEEDSMDEEEEVEAVQPALRRRPRMLAELQSTLDGWYWRQATTRRFIDRN